MWVHKRGLRNAHHENILFQYFQLSCRRLAMGAGGVSVLHHVSERPQSSGHGLHLLRGEAGRIIEHQLRQMSSASNRALHTWASPP
jgi:hypothetical protein